MKKLFLLGLLICSFSMSAQQFIQNYNWVLMTKDGVKGVWTETNVTTYYNYNNDLTKVKMDVNGLPFNMTQVGLTSLDKTSSGIEYQKMEMTDDETGESLTLKLYEDTKYGVMVIFEGIGNSLQFAP
jgi:hypothetical protein